METSQKKEVSTDMDVIDKVLLGDIQLYELIVRRYNPYLYRIGKTYGFDHQDVQDVMQETYVNAYRNLASFKRESTFRTWLTRIMLNNCYHKKKKINRKKEVSADSFDGIKKAHLSSDTMRNTKTINKELGSVLEKAIENLPEKYKIVFTLRELNSLSIAETCDALGISAGNVKVRLNRAKAFLRTDIEKMYSPQEIFELNLIYCDSMVENVMSAIHLIEKETSMK